MKRRKKSLANISLIIGYIAVLAGAWFMIKHLKGIIVIFIIGFSALLIYTWATIKDTRENNRYNPK